MTLKGREDGTEKDEGAQAKLGQCIRGKSVLRSNI